MQKWSGDVHFRSFSGVPLPLRGIYGASLHHQYTTEYVIPSLSSTDWSRTMAAAMKLITVRPATPLRGQISSRCRDRVSGRRTCACFHRPSPEPPGDLATQQPPPHNSTNNYWHFMAITQHTLLASQPSQEMYECLQQCFDTVG